MSTWSEFEAAAPDFASEVRARLDAHTHKTIATLRRDGSPRISGTESRFDDGFLWIGSMPGALKAKDLQRDGRYALHSGSDDPPNWVGDAKLAGRAEEVTDPAIFEKLSVHAPPGPFHIFRLQISEASIVALNEDESSIVVRVWTPEKGVREIRRD